MKFKQDLESSKKKPKHQQRNNGKETDALKTRLDCDVNVSLIQILICRYDVINCDHFQFPLIPTNFVIFITLYNIIINTI